MSEFCRVTFLEGLLNDFGLNVLERDRIIFKLSDDVIGTYNANKPTNSLGDIANNLYQCLRPTINDVSRITAQELTSTLFYVLILTAAFVILIVVILMIMDDTKEYFWIVTISIYFALLYIGIVYALAKNAEINISNNITNAEIKATDCVNAAVNELTLFLNRQQTAISDALCAYPFTENSTCFVRCPPTTITNMLEY